MNESGAIVGVVGLVLVVLFFLLGRKIVCWYWKIDQRIALLEEIRDLLKTQKPAAGTTLKNWVTCSLCGLTQSKDGTTCKKCGGLL